MLATRGPGVLYKILNKFKKFEQLTLTLAPELIGFSFHFHQPLL